MSRPERVLVIFNPTAGRRRRHVLHAALDALRRFGVAVDLRPTEEAGHAVRLAGAADAGAHDLVIAAGGDGTINEVATGLLQAADPPPLAILPLGTANVLAIETGLSAYVETSGRPAPEAMALAIVHGCPGIVWPALWRPEDSGAEARAVLLMAGCGFDAEVVHRVAKRRFGKRLLGKGAYVLQSILAAFRYGFPELEIEVDGMLRRASGVVVCKARHYGGPHLLAASAALSSPSVEVCILTERGWLAQLRYGLDLLAGRLADRPDVEFLRGRHVDVRGAAVQVDGDAVMATGIHVAVSKRPLRLILPPVDGLPLKAA